ncbi:hypothetical protein SAMN05216350_105233 [Polaromonas sp. YR568]|uniref:hypothetical protein n=1 Tax=Polaromonas sp. YR568 TaxID=1855301 RepID=UPI0008E075F9|nr:hypothetical protein [Polaromonas sp. YR568]SFU80324.1 hypothetical protein SAMN05216350_105233 [Polaromonas sp. YR568]
MPVSLKRTIGAVIIANLTAGGSIAFAQEAVTPDTAAVMATPAPVPVAAEVRLPSPDAPVAAVPVALPVVATPASGDAVAPVTITLLPAVAATPLATASIQLPVSYSRFGPDNVATKEVMDELRVVRQQATHNAVGQQVVLNVAMMLLSGGRALNFQSVSKDNFAGISPEGAVNTARLTNPARTLLPGELQQRVSTWLAGQDKTRDMKFTGNLVVNSATWRLVYNSLDPADTAYRLRLETEIFKVRESSSFFMPKVRAGKPCKYESDARPMSEWQAGDYQAVVDLAPVAVKQCATEFAAQLADLLELN